MKAAEGVIEMYEMPSWKRELKRRLAALRKRPASEGRAAPAAVAARGAERGPYVSRRSASPAAGK